ncbi:hypothetical protein ACFY1B_39050 [Streptomyces mirabilis]|uniref:hypothetical protein n=1 Tax=Streptomyces mirabilis TaxID=68239 RepID=UPI0036842015
MTQAGENGIDPAATVVTPTAEAAELQPRINALREELMALNERDESHLRRSAAASVPLSSRTDRSRPALGQPQPGIES